MKKLLKLIGIFVILGTGHAVAMDHHTTQKNDRSAITILLDGFHDAASQADLDRYLRYFTEDGVFMGTDDWERWPLNPDFRNYVAERFKDGKGWTYKAIERHIAFDPTGKVAWFDEITKSEKYGVFRGTGVLLKAGPEWKLAHYSMSVLVPNEAFMEVSDLSKAAMQKRKEINK